MQYDIVSYKLWLLINSSLFIHIWFYIHTFNFHFLALDSPFLIHTSEVRLYPDLYAEF